MNGRRPASPPPGRCEHATQLPLLQTLPGHSLRGQIHSKGLHSSAPWLNVGFQNKVLGRGMMLMLETDWAEVEAADYQTRMQAMRCPCALKALGVSVQQGSESKARQATKAWFHSASHRAEVQTQASESKGRQRWLSTWELHCQSKIKESESAWDKAVQGSNSIITMIRWIVKLVNKTVYHLIIA